MPFAIFMMVTINVVNMTMGMIVPELETVPVMLGLQVPPIRFVKDRVAERRPVNMWLILRPVPR
jgi:hypothetical protein